MMLSKVFSGKIVVPISAFVALLLILLIAHTGFTQQIKTLGMPAIRNFTAKEYDANDQNWAIIQDSRGVMYFGNTNGLLEYDGTFWKFIEMPNKSTVRSLCLDSLGRIYVGAENEFGYLSSDSVGDTKYNSLVNLIPENERIFNDVRNIYQLSNQIVFLTVGKLFILKNRAIKIIKSETSFHLSFKIGDKIYVREENKGLKVYDGNSFNLVKGSEIFANERIYTMCPFGVNRILIGTGTQNFFLYNGIHFSKFRTSCDDLFRSGQIYCGLQINDSIYAIGTVLNGLFFINNSGKLIKTIDKSAGLLDNQIHVVFSDNAKNLWLANDVGISKIDINSPFSYLEQRNNLDTYCQVVSYYNDKLYVGGGPFLFYNSVSKLADSNFTQIKESTNQVWKLYCFDNKLFVAQNARPGFLDQNNSFTALGNIDAWTFSSVRNKPDYLIMGLDDGMYYLKKKNNQWMQQGRIKGFDFVTRFIESDSLSNLWVEVLNKGVFKLQLNDKGDRIIDQKLLIEYAFSTECISIIDNQVIVAKNNKFLRYNYNSEKFEDYIDFNQLFPKSKGLKILGKSGTGDIYFQDNISIGKLIAKNKRDYMVCRTPFFSLEKMTGVYPAIEIDESNAFIGRDKGFVHYQPNYKKDYSQQFNTLIRKVQILPIDSLIFDGNFPLKSEPFSLWQAKNQIPNLAYKYNSIRFLFSATFYENPERTEYQYQLTGFENGWSTWTTEIKKEYTNLHEGKYSFKVRAKNVYGTISEPTVYEFEILPPWNRTWCAYAIYFALFIFSMLVVLKLNSKRLRHQKYALERIISERTEQLQKSEEKFRTVADFTYGWEYWTDPDRKLLYISPACEKITGYKQERFYSDPKFIDTLIYSKDAGLFKQHIDTFHIGSKSADAREIEFRIVDITGNEKWIAHACQPITDSKGNYLGRRSSNRDITESKKAEESIVRLNEELKQNVAKVVATNKELESFSYSVSHDLRAPLRGIDGFSNLLLKNYAEILDDQGRNYLQRIKIATLRMSDLIDDLLKLARLTRVDMHREKTNLSDIAEIISEEFNVSNPSRKVNFIIQQEMIENVDRNLIQIVLQNLIGNACKYSKNANEPKIEFGKFREENKTVYFIRDNGAGFEMKYVDKLFGPFQRLHTSAEFEGTGIGLATVQRIIYRHGGRVWAEGEVNNGATFYFTIN